MTDEMHRENRFFDVGARPNLIRKYYLEAEWRRDVQANNQSSLKNATNPKNSVAWKIVLHFNLRAFKARVVLGVVRSLMLTVVLENLFVDRFVKAITPPEQNTVPSNAKPIPILSINHDPEEKRNRNDKAQDVITSIEETVSYLVNVKRQTETLPRSEGIVFCLDIRKRASTDRTTVKAGQYVDLGDSLGHYPRVPEQTLHLCSL